MTNALKGVLLSGLVLPGLGQFLLDRKIRGSLIMVVVLSILGALTVQVTRTALAVMEKVDLQAAQLDVNVFYDAVRQADMGNGIMLSWLILFCWLAATIDAFIIGKKMDKEGVKVT